MPIFRTTPRAPTIAFWTLVAGACVPLLAAGSREWLSFDDWTLLITRREVLETDGVLDFLLRRHNEHLLPGLVLWDVALASVFGIDSYLPWTATVIGALVATAWVVRRVMISVGMSPPAAALAAPVLLIWADFGHSLTWVPETVFVLYLALVLAHLVIVVADPDASVRREATGSALSVCAVLLHSAAAVAVLPVAAVLVLQRRWRAAALSAIPLALYGIWLATWGREPEVFDDILTQPGRGVLGAPIGRFQFAWAIGGQGFRFVAGPAAPWVWFALIIAGLAFAWRRRAAPVGTVLLCLVAMSVIAVGAITRSRSALGTFAQTSPQSRYAVLVILPLLPVAGLALESIVRNLARRGRWPKGVAVGSAITLAGSLIAASVIARADDHDNSSAITRSIRQTMAAIISTPSTRTTRSDIGLSGWFFDLDVAGVWQLHDWGWYKPEPSTDQRHLLTVQARVLVHGGTGSPDDRPARLHPGSAVVVTPRGDCWTLSPRDTTSGNRTTVDSTDGPVVLEVVAGAENIWVQARRDDEKSPWYSLLVDPATDDVRVHPDPGVQIVLKFTGPATICGVTIDDG